MKEASKVWANAVAGLSAVERTRPRLAKAVVKEMGRVMTWKGSGEGMNEPPLADARGQSFLGDQ